VNNREVKRRISSVKETVKIYRAMYSISVARMIKCRAALPIAERFYHTSGDLLSRLTDRPMDFFRERGHRTAFIVIGGDKGLCGDYNEKIALYAASLLRAAEEKYLFTVGSVTRDMISKYGFAPDVEFLHSADNPSPEAAFSMAADLMNLYEEGMLDEVRLVYSDVVDNRPVPVSERILPFLGTSEALRDETEPLRETPTEGAVRRSLYTYLASALYRALILASLAEHLSRVRAMPQATENAEKMIADLTAKYNKIRQESITRALQDVGSFTDE